MRKFGLIISALALVLGLAQCAKKPNMPTFGSVEHSIKTITFTTNGGGNEKGELVDLTTLLRYKWNIDGNAGKIDQLHVYVQDNVTEFTGGKYLGSIPIVKVNGDYEAVFKGDLVDVPTKGVLRFVHFGPGVEVGEGGSASVDFASQDGDLKTISNSVVAVCDIVVDKDPDEEFVFEDYMLDVQFSVIKLKFKDFGDGDVNVIGGQSTGLSIAETGVITNNNCKSVVLKTPMENDFYAVLMPKSETEYKFVNAEAMAERPWSVDKNKFYTENATGESFVIEKEQDPAETPSVKTLRGCSSTYAFNCGGMVTVTKEQTCEFGVVYSMTNTNPEIGGDGCEKVVVGNEKLTVGSHEFNYDMTGLDPTKNYYIRAYVIGENLSEVHASGVRDVVKVGPEQPLGWDNAESPYGFSVTDTKQVRFSSGNLQWSPEGTHAVAQENSSGDWNGTEGTWRFAGHQYELLGDNGQNTNALVDRDLFGWGTSGWSNGNTYYRPNDITEGTVGYGPVGTDNDLTGAYANADWGVYNDISNDGDGYGVGAWRTLTASEFVYLFDGSKEKRKDATFGIPLFGLGKVGCTTGIVVLPDNWVFSSADEFVGGMTGTGYSYDNNQYSYAEWADMEVKGAVFLPAAGRRMGYKVISCRIEIGYFSSSTHADGTHDVCRLYYNGSNGSFWADATSDRSYGCPIRLVRDAE